MGLNPTQRQARLQATYRCRCHRFPVCDLGQRGEPARLQDVREVRGRDSCDCWLERAPSQKTIEAARRRFERRLDIHEALLKLAAALICARFVDR
jgi:hypothetical protein